MHFYMLLPICEYIIYFCTQCWLHTAPSPVCLLRFSVVICFFSLLRLWFWLLYLAILHKKCGSKGERKEMTKKEHFSAFSMAFSGISVMLFMACFLFVIIIILFDMIWFCIFPRFLAKNKRWHRGSACCNDVVIFKMTGKSHRKGLWRRRLWMMIVQTMMMTVDIVFKGKCK